MWILAIIIILLIWGNLSKKSSCHPLNSVCIKSIVVGSGGCGGSTSGDCMTKGCTISPGVPEPLPKALPPTPVIKAVGTPIPIYKQAPLMPVNVSTPTDPPPIAIQNRPIMCTSSPAHCCHISVNSGNIGGGFLNKIIRPSTGAPVTVSKKNL